MARRVSVLGATGSVGAAAMDVLRAHPDLFALESLVAHHDAAKLAALALELRPQFVALADETLLGELRERLAHSEIACGAGANAVLEAVARPADIVVAAIAGTAGLPPTHAALQPGRRIALANKESLVCAGAAFMRDAARLGVEILPLDSEHNAIFQALGGRAAGEVESMVLTASGGPFRTWDAQRIAGARPHEAVAHPNWSMGAKISVDSASLMNKGLELIEAHHLFQISADRLAVVVHPQSVVHGLVTFADGSCVAGLAMPDMRVPVAHCLGYPGRLATACRRLDLASLGSLDFEPPDLQRFPALALAQAALRQNGAFPTILNAANEVAVAAFLADAIPFGAIATLVERVLDGLADRGARTPATVGEALDVHHVARIKAQATLRMVLKQAH
jgi:1-deoxy-D-xylulose-5-phosphate reductoisomerase